METLIKYLASYKINVANKPIDSSFEQFHSFESAKGYLTMTIRKYLGICFVQTDISLFETFTRSEKNLFFKEFQPEVEQLAKKWNCKSIVHTTYQRGETTENAKSYFSILEKNKYFKNNSSKMYLMDTTCNLFYKNLEPGHFQRVENFIAPFFDAMKHEFKQDITAVIRDAILVDRYPQSKVAINLIYFGKIQNIYLDFFEDQFCIKNPSVDPIIDVNTENLMKKANEVYASMLNTHRLKNIFEPSIYHFRKLFKSRISESDSFLAFSLQRIKKFFQISEEQLERKIMQEYDALIAELNVTHFFQDGVEIIHLFGIRFLFHRLSEGSRLYICTSDAEFLESFEKIKAETKTIELKKIDTSFESILTNYESMYNNITNQQK